MKNEVRADMLCSKIYGTNGATKSNKKKRLLKLLSLFHGPTGLDEETELKTLTLYGENISIKRCVISYNFCIFI